MILVLMTSRSGSSLVAGIFAAHGFDTGGPIVLAAGYYDTEGRKVTAGYETFENAAVNQFMRDHKTELKLITGQFCDYIPGVEKCIPPNGVVKIGVEYLTLFEKLDPMVIAVRRDTVSISRSLASKRGHPDQASGVEHAVRSRMMALDRAVRKWNGAWIDVDQIMAGDFSGVKAAFDHHGIPFDEAKARACVNPDIWHKW